MNNKIVSYIGFAVKKGSVKYGVDEILKSGYKIKLVIYNYDLAQNSLKKIEKFLADKNIEGINLIEELKFVFNSKGTKVIGITDESLKLAILKEYRQNI